MNHAGAIASNAGDDFHLIWAGKKVIEMLKPNSELSAVVVEGPALEDAVVIEDQSLLYSIDMTEYYGGKNFDEAKKVVFSQLKYSAYLPEKEWNLSRLCASSGEKQSNSVIRRMADTYKGFAERYLDISGKIALKFVSNQALEQNLKESITECKKILSKKLYKRATTLIKKLNGEHKSIVNTIYETSKLSSEQFIGFIQALDFGDCGTGVRQVQEMEIMRQIGIWGFNNQKSSYNNLIMAIRRCMLPEGKDTLIDKNWVKAVLEIDERSIFPAPSRVTLSNVKYIIKEGEQDTVAQFLKNTKHWTCFYGMAGAGKTTFVGNIESYLPKESVVVLYDCYGGGTFLQPDQPRHRKEIAIRQICNMLALKCKTELLLGTLYEDYLWWDALKKRLNQAAELVRAKNSEALVVVIIDAADNGIFAANKMKQECFLTELLKLDLSKNIRIVATARTERVSLLPEIEKAEKLEIPLFNKENSLDHLKSYFPEATNEIGEEFHELTKGNPRLQNYIISTTKELERVLDFVRPDGKKLEDIFEDFIESVEKQYAGVYDTDLIFFAASRMIRPIPIETICSICGISSALLDSVCVECHYGLYNKNGQLSFSDEDFENYLQSKYCDSEYYMSKIADYLYEKRNEDAYCARFVHLFLDAANQFERIIQISLKEEVDGANVGVAQSNKIMLERIHTALARPEMQNRNYRVDVYKLMYRQADFCAGEDSLSKLLYEAPEEISIFCDEMSIRSVTASSDNSFEALGRKALLSVGLVGGKERAKEYINSKR